MARDIPYGERHIETKLSRIGAKVVKATEMSTSAKKLCAESHELLLDAQVEIAELYESLTDILEKEDKRGP
ncbi:hypothetical protein LJC49_08125 [Ruminococcaceae bacterium OttesenSCG-928-I18]|nr:hypothetical protein [Ruminococcaceae bacterium OttesenSCG-928-I18]